MKIFAVGIKSYLHNNWNKFDCIIAFIGLFDILIDSNIGLENTKSVTKTILNNKNFHKNL